VPRRRARGAGPMTGRTVRTLDLRDTDNAWLRLHYRANGDAVDYKVQLVTTKPNYGGHRWWFICPIVRRDGGPPRRVAKLYLLSAASILGVARHYGLTYTSCQESGKQTMLDPFQIELVLL
jgi:hypothetical protein